jgi:hypothetical protein
VRLEVAHLLQPVGQVAGALHEALGIAVVERLPPQREEQHAVLGVGHALLDLAEQGHGLLVLGVGGEAQRGIGVNAVSLDDRGFVFLQQRVEVLGRDRLLEQLAAAFDLLDLALERLERLFDDLWVGGGQQGVELPARGSECHSGSLSGAWRLQR